MTLSGNMIVKNGIKFDYPFVEACLSILPICDEFVFLEGCGDDGTYERLLELQAQHPKIRVLRHPWPQGRTTGGEVLAEMTNVAIAASKCTYFWNIQADEAIHECYHPVILEHLRTQRPDYAWCDVQHFWSNFDTIYKPGVFYDSFIRLGRKACFPNLKSLGDAMSLGVLGDTSKYHVTRIPMCAFHYGYVRKPKCLIEKQAEITRYWGYQGWADLDPYLSRGYEKGEVVWTEKHTPDQLRPFNDTHPAPYRAWIDERRPMVAAGKVV